MRQSASSRSTSFMPSVPAPATLRPPPGFSPVGIYPPMVGRDRDECVLPSQRLASHVQFLVNSRSHPAAMGASNSDAPQSDQSGRKSAFIRTPSGVAIIYTDFFIASVKLSRPHSAMTENGDAFITVGHTKFSGKNRRSSSIASAILRILSTTPNMEP